MKEIQRAYLPIANINSLMRIICVFIFVLIKAFLSAEIHAEEYPFLGAVTAEDVNVRAGQSKNFEAVAQMMEGEKVVVVGKEYSWYKIKLPPQAKSYVSADFVLKMRDNVGTITADRVNIRARKDLGAAILGRVNKNDLVRIKAQDDQWVQIEPVDQSFGWIHENLIMFYSRDVPPPRTVELPTRNIYKRKRMLARQKVQQKKIEVPAVRPTPKPAVTSEPPPVKKLQEDLIKITGVIRPLGERSITQNIRHQIQGEDNQTYYLKGYRTIIDTFLNYKVHIEAELLSDIQAPAPVVLVRKIQLIL